ncbi:MAG TPA: OmpA family protein [Candidatus Acidoferrales bacterium]|nr:OmpA family protein [Candidatus Acidoferrales bacterium]
MNRTLRIRARGTGARLIGRPGFFLLSSLLLNFLLLGFSLLARPLPAQEQTQDQPQQHPQQAPVISINITRTIQAVNYRTKGSTRINFRGTALLPQGTGEAKIGNKSGAITIDAKFENLSAPSQFGSPYLTYVLWAITPEGRATNLGQLVLEGSKSKLVTTTELQTFGLIVTAEPDFGVTVPSEDVVLENIVRADTQGKVDAVAASYELLRRGRYDDANLPPLEASSNVPLDLLEARNAMRIAKLRQADKYAPDSWAKATDAMNRAEDYETRKQRKSVPTAARDAVQGFEDAITIALKRQDEERLAQERAAAAQREAQAKADQATEAQRRAEAEKQALEAQLAAAKDAQARAEAQAQQQQAQAQAQQAQLQAQQAQVAAEQAHEAEVKAQLEATQEAQARAAAQAQQQQAQAQAQQAEAQAQQARDAASKAEQEQQQLRATLLAQFNRILETRDTPRGLVVNIGDVLFATGRYDLRPEARERLAKLSGIVLAHPGLKLAVEGYTDNVGSEEFNQTLSEHRASAVRQYLVDQGLDTDSITATGLGMSSPVADNGTAAGRQKNRRVEIVISGEVIGTKIGATPNQPQQ